MTAELGQTDAPIALVPGDPGAVTDAAGSFQVYGNLLHEAGTGLQRIDTRDGWSGPAADAFRDVFRGQPGKWLTAGDCFHDASDALTRYADTLGWAQGQAADAIRRWAAGQATTQAAQARYTQAVATAQQQAAAGGPILSVGPFVDPGAAERQAAQDTLDRARSQLRSAAADAARVVAEARDEAPQKPGFWDKVGAAADDVWHGFHDAGRTAVNDLASFGNAALHHPGDVGIAVAGVLLTAVSGAGEVGGVALDATGVGAVAGVPLNVLSAAGIAAGVGLTGAAVADIATNAAGGDQVEPLGSGRSSPPGGSGDTGPGTTIGREDLSSGQQSNLGRYTKKLPAGAEDPTITQLEDGSVRFESKVPGRVPGSYALYTKTVAEDGTTIGYTKTTVTPDGSVAHVKDKLVP